MIFTTIHGSNHLKSSNKCYHSNQSPILKFGPNNCLYFLNIHPSAEINYFQAIKPFIEHFQTYVHTFCLLMLRGDFSPLYIIQCTVRITWKPVLMCASTVLQRLLYCPFPPWPEPPPPSMKVIILHQNKFKSCASVAQITASSMGLFFAQKSSNKWPHLWNALSYSWRGQRSARVDVNLRNSLIVLSLFVEECVPCGREVKARWAWCPAFFPKVVTLSPVPPNDQENFPSPVFRRVVPKGVTTRLV